MTAWPTWCAYVSFTAFLCVCVCLCVSAFIRVSACLCLKRHLWSIRQRLFRLHNIFGQIFEVVIEVGREGAQGSLHEKTRGTSCHYLKGVVCHYLKIVVVVARCDMIYTDTMKTLPLFCCVLHICLSVGENTQTLNDLSSPSLRHSLFAELFWSVFREAGGSRLSFCSDKRVLATPKPNLLSTPLI